MSNINNVINGLIETDSMIISSVEDLDSDKASQADVENLDMSVYQTKTDNSLKTTNKNVPSAINELYTYLDTLLNRIQSSTQQVISSLESINSNNTNTHNDFIDTINSLNTEIQTIQEQINNGLPGVTNQTLVTTFTASYNSTTKKTTLNLTSSFICRVTYIYKTSTGSEQNLAFDSDIGTRTYTNSFTRTLSYLYVYVNDGFINYYYKLI